MLGSRFKGPWATHNYFAAMTRPKDQDHLLPFFCKPFNTLGLATGTSDPLLSPIPIYNRTYLGEHLQGAHSSIRGPSQGKVSLMLGGKVNEECFYDLIKGISSFIRPRQTRGPPLNGK